MALAAAFGRHRGTVASFDEVAGRGTVVGEDGTEWYLHCTKIADGSRRIEVGARVSFAVAPGPAGLEAVEVGPPDQSSPGSSAGSGLADAAS